MPVAAVGFALLAGAWVMLAVVAVLLLTNEYMVRRRKPRSYREVDLTGKKPRQ